MTVLVLLVVLVVFSLRPAREVRRQEYHPVDEAPRLRRHTTLDDDPEYRAKVKLRMREGYTRHQLRPLIDVTGSGRPPCTSIAWADGFDPEHWRQRKVAQVVGFKRPERMG